MCISENDRSWDTGVTMKVFGIGLNKTGTKSLGYCFRSFGFKNSSYNLDLLKEYSKGNFDPIFDVSDRFDSFEDWPWPLLFKELDTRYPDALFVLTTRKDPETWFDSLCHHADRTGPTEARAIAYHHEMPHAFRREHINLYVNHNEEVRRHFQSRPGKLLEVCWECGDGWSKIAPFFGMPIPKTPFPHENKGNFS